MNKQQFLNIYINNMDMSETILYIQKLVEENNISYVVPVNTDVIVKIESDPYLKKIVEEAELVLPDGQPLIWLSKIQKKQLKEKVSGSDLVPQLCEVAAQKGYKVFFLGGKEDVAEQAKKNLENSYPKIKIVGTYAPPIGFEGDEKKLDEINTMIKAASPDLLIVCLGCPKQEKFIYENYEKYGAKVSICAGATIDFLAGNIKRAPKWMSKCGLEWFYRFLSEPKRLFKRYFIDDTKILMLAWKYRRGK